MEDFETTTKVILREDIIQLANLNKELVEKYKSNPYFEYRNHPIIDMQCKQAEMWFAIQYKAFPTWCLKQTVEYGFNYTRVISYVEVI